MNKPFYLPSAIFLAWMFNIGLLPVTITTALIRPKCPELCPSECPEPIDCSEVIQDECGCCPLCVRNMHETCGSIDGVCRPPLQCRRLTPDSDQGRCVEMWPEKCLKAKCEMVYLQKCPEDSQRMIPLPPPGECCAPPAECHCDLQKCDPFIPICEEGMERVLIKEGTSEPGHCCDQFECRRPEVQCEGIHCEDIDDSLEVCPSDSIKATSYVPEGHCCPIHPGCRCRASICFPAQCPQGQKVIVLQKGNGTPGRCCDQFICEEGDDSLSKEAKKCPYKGKMYDDGEVWHSNSCEQCKCKGGIALCSKMTCAYPPAQCTWVSVPEHECCPVCFGCLVDGVRRTVNESWQKDDCTSCSCGPDGVHFCQKHMCQVHCDHPRKVPGQCCPICDEPTVVLNPSVCASIEHCPLRCTNGLLRDSQGCFQCICAPHERPSGSQCKQLTEANCDRICAHGYLRDEKGCATCKCAKCPILHQCYKHCLYGFETNNFGCPLCKCRSMSRIDAKLIPMERKGRKGSDTCLSVNSATNKVVERDSGEWWNDGCRHCFCEQKHEFCSLISCPERPESCPLEQWKKEEGSCCPYCALDPSTATSKHEHTVCQSAGRLFVDGETWQLASCTSCTCRVGNVLCRVVECAPIACVNPIYDDSNKCCPICPDQVKHNETIPALPNFANNACVDEAGMVHVHGTAWRIDECTSCRCKESDDGDSHIECYKEKCEKLEDCMGMPLTIKGRCCPICSDMLSSGTMCNYNNNVYSVNEEWRDGPCRNCTCQPGGRTVCNEQQCPPCHDPLLVRGKCCPICRDDGWQSLGENRPHTIFLDNDGGANPTNALLYGLCLFGFIVIALVIFIIIYKLIKKMNDHSEKKSPIHFNNSAVYLSSSKPIGSTPQIFEEFTKRRDSCGDGQSESLLSTTSETSSAISTNSSSGHGPHFDTLPLTAKKVAQRTKSMDYGIRRGFGSFKSSTLGKISQKHGSCNV